MISPWATEAVRVFDLKLTLRICRHITRAGGADGWARTAWRSEIAAGSEMGNHFVRISGEVLALVVVGAPADGRERADGDPGDLSPGSFDKGAQGPGTSNGSVRPL